MFYEARPFAYATISFYALAYSKNSLLMTLSGGVLALCCVLVFVLRFDNRRHMARLHKQHLASLRSAGSKSQGYGEYKNNAYHID